MSLLAVFGPTASGKTPLAEALAAHVGGELVSADSMQMYRGLPMLTNQSAYPTHLVAVWPLDHEGSVGEYARLAHAAIDDILERGQTPIVVGGTGLYLRAALVELGVPPRAPAGLRRRMEAVYDRVGPARAHDLLRRRDPAAAARVHANDRRRVVRGLELSALGSSLLPRDDRLWSGELRHPTTIFGLDVPLPVLDRRIAERTRRMFADGVEEEVRRALAGPISPTARAALGLEQIAELPAAEAEAALTRATRRLARYQRKWMRRVPGLLSLDADRSIDEVLADALARLRVPVRA